METNPPPVAPDPFSPAPKKPMSTGAKIGIGCGALTVVAVIILIVTVGWCTSKFGDLVKDFQDNPERASAELIVKLNPDLEFISSDDDSATITFRDKSSGKEMTMDWSDVAEGKFTIRDEEGNETSFGAGSMDGVPSWVPRLPRVTQANSDFHAIEGGKTSGSYSATTPMTADEVVDFIKAQAAELGMESTLDNRVGNDSEEIRMLGFKKESQYFTASVITSPSEPLKVVFVYGDE